MSASCAIPGVWPAVTVGDTRYIDGGIRSSTNLDLAAGHARTLVIAPMPDPVLDADAASIAERGGLIDVITPDEATLAACGTTRCPPPAGAPRATPVSPKDARPQRSLPRCGTRGSTRRGSGGRWWVASTLWFSAGRGPRSHEGVRS
ncbi:patatin-like phospholipase family protein [Streptomyces sp. NPDC102441]|uniref:patatin-like phospholipase family protein n=1 Tax=Streptomyces sp. NPDC102441 TaxID=3366176 RepID=UPI0037FBCDF0